MIGITVITLSICVCLWYITKYIIWLIRAINMTANIPGPKALPFIGNALTFAKISTQEELLNTIMSLFKEYSTNDGIIKLWLGPKPVIFVANPKFVETLLISQDAIQKDDDIYKFIGLIGNGVFVRNGQEWQELRKPLNKFLTKKMLESNINVFHEKGMQLWNMLNKFADTGTDFNLRPYMTNYSFDILCVTNLGHDLNAIDNDYKLEPTLQGMEDIALKMMTKIPYNICLPYAKLSMAGRRLKKLSKVFWNLSQELLESRLQNKKLLKEENDPNPSFYSDVLLEKALRDKLSWEDSGRLVTDFLVAGFDTVATTLSYTLLYLAMYPEHQEAVYQEQIEILGYDTEVPPTWEQLSKMTYLTRVLKEVWRLNSAIGIVRKLTNDINLGDYNIPEGFAAYVMLNTLHRNPKIWSHPNEFYPDHFLPEEIAKRPKGSYLPFSVGPRSCPGTSYANISSKTLLSVAVRKYTFETDLELEKLEYKYSLLLEPIQTYLVRIRNRK